MGPRKLANLVHYAKNHIVREQNANPPSVTLIPFYRIFVCRFFAHFCFLFFFFWDLELNNLIVVFQLIYFHLKHVLIYLQFMLALFGLVKLMLDETLGLWELTYLVILINYNINDVLCVEIVLELMKQILLIQSWWVLDLRLFFTI